MRSIWRIIVPFDSLLLKMISNTWLVSVINSLPQFSLTKLVPLSDIITLGYPHRATKCLMASMHESVSKNAVNYKAQEQDIITLPRIHATLDFYWAKEIHIYSSNRCSSALILFSGKSAIFCSFRHQTLDHGAGFNNPEFLPPKRNNGVTVQMRNNLMSINQDKSWHWRLCRKYHRMFCFIRDFWSITASTNTHNTINNNNRI